MRTLLNKVDGHGHVFALKQAPGGGGPPTSAVGTVVENENAVPMFGEQLCFGEQLLTIGKEAMHQHNESAILWRHKVASQGDTVICKEGDLFRFWQLALYLECIGA